MKRLLWILILSGLVFSQTAEDIVKKAEESLKKLQSYQARFEQIYVSNTVSIPLEEKGRLLFQKPDRMKWVYEEPEEKVFLTKDGSFEFYVPEDKQMIRGVIQDEGHEGEILFIISGQKSILESYWVEISGSASENQNNYQLRLTPKTEEYYAYLLLDFDKDDLLLKRIVLFDWAGNKTETSFSRIRTNIRFSKKDFQLDVPADVEIIEY